jgi:hypothetical protein
MTPSYPEPEYLMITDTTTAELRAQPHEVVQRLLQPLARGLSEPNLFPYINPRELFSR